MVVDFTGKRALVTGAGRGIGRQIALHLSKCGAEVFALSKTKTRLDSLRVEDSKIKTICCDVSDWEATRSAVKEILPIQLLVNNAASYRMEKLSDATKENFDAVFSVNLLGPLNISQVITNDLIERGLKGSVVNVSTDGAFMGYSDALSYNMSKAALDCLGRCAVAEMSPKGIRFNNLNLTLVLTDTGKIWVEDNVERAAEYKAMIPLQRFLEISDVVSAVAFLLSDQSFMINGLSIPMDGGLFNSFIFPADFK